MLARALCLALLLPTLAVAGPVLPGEAEGRAWSQGADGEATLILQSCQVSKLGDTFKVSGPAGTETLTRAQFDLLLRIAGVRTGTSTLPVFGEADEDKMIQWLEDPAHVGGWAAARDGNDVMLCHSQPDGQIAVYPDHRTPPTLHPRATLRQSIGGGAK